MADFPAPKEGIALTHFIVSANVERASLVHSHVSAATCHGEGEPTIIALENTHDHQHRRAAHSTTSLSA